MKRIYSAVIFCFVICGCQLNKTPLPADLLQGTWYHIGTLTSASTPIPWKLDTVRTDQAINFFTLSANNKLSGRIRNLIIEANYVAQPLTTNDSLLEGKLRISGLQVLNKPWENAADTQFREDLEAINTFTLYKRTPNFDMLKVKTSTQRSLVFVRTRPVLF